MKTHTHAGISSGRVVAIMRNSLELCNENSHDSLLLAAPYLLFQLELLQFYLLDPKTQENFFVLPVLFLYKSKTTFERFSVNVD